MAAAPNEFADWLSPILVKELRQGMRTRVFVGSFILLQIAMVFLTLFGLSAASEGKSTDDFSTTFWVIVAIPLLLIMPASGLGAIATERKGNTLELVFLSRLTARRILFGKWAALLLQSVLMVCAVIPYAVLRYFLGGVDVSLELQILVSLLYFSTVFSGIAVGLSPLPLAATRAIAIVVILFGIQGFSVLMISIRFTGTLGLLSSFPTFSALATCVAAVLIGLAVLYLFWEYGAGQIAPAVENHSTPLRLLVLGCLGVAALVTAMCPKYKTAALMPALIIGVLVCLGVISEQMRLLPGLYRPFVKRGVAARFSGWILYPGWPAGVLFTALFFLISYGLSHWVLGPFKAWQHEDDFLLGWLVALGAIIAPVAIIRLCMPRAPRPFLAFFLLQVMCVVLAAVSSILRAFSPGLDPRPLFRLVPHLCAVCPRSGHVFAAQFRPGRGGDDAEFAAAALADARALALDPRLRAAGGRLAMATALPTASELVPRMQAVAEHLSLPWRSRQWRGQAGGWMGVGSGSSIDFQDHRPYLPGDDPRYIDWRAFARTGHYIMKLYREEVSPMLDLVLDVSPSMAYRPEKRQRVLELLLFAVSSARRSAGSLRVFAASADAVRPLEPERAPGEGAALFPKTAAGPPLLAAVPWRSGIHARADFGSALSGRAAGAAAPAQRRAVARDRARAAGAPGRLIRTGAGIWSWKIARRGGGACRWSIPRCGCATAKATCGTLRSGRKSRGGIRWPLRAWRRNRRSSKRCRRRRCRPARWSYADLCAAGRILGAPRDPRGAGDPFSSARIAPRGGEHALPSGAAGAGKRGRPAPRAAAAIGADLAATAGGAAAHVAAGAAAMAAAGFRPAGGGAAGQFRFDVGVSAADCSRRW